jgi:hypothetical protein
MADGCTERDDRERDHRLRDRVFVGHAVGLDRAGGGLRVQILQLLGGHAVVLDGALTRSGALLSDDGGALLREGRRLAEAGIRECQGSSSFWS